MTLSVFRRHGLLFLAVILIFLSSCATSPDQQQARMYASGLESSMNRSSGEVSAKITDEWGFVCTGIWEEENPSAGDVLGEHKGPTAFNEKEADALFDAAGAYKVMHFMKFLRTEKVSIRTISSTGDTRVINIGKTRDVNQHAYIRVVFRDDKLVHFKVWPCVESQLN
jgi:hypothetical protein